MLAKDHDDVVVCSRDLHYMYSPGDADMLGMLRALPLNHFPLSTKHLLTAVIGSKPLRVHSPR